MRNSRAESMHQQENSRRRKMHRDYAVQRRNICFGEDFRNRSAWQSIPRRSPKSTASSARSLLSADSAQPSATRLRRTLLSSIEGAAVTAVRIEGVLHEFQSIAGVVEDATDIILNLKQIPFKLNGEGPKALYLRADQPGVVTRGMIEADGEVEILDKDVYIAPS